MAKATRTPKAPGPAAGEIQDIPHEDLPVGSAPETQKTEAVIITTEEKITLEIAKYNIPRAAIAKWKEETADLLLVKAGDKEGYKKLKEAIAWSRGKRGQVKETYDEITEESKIITNALRKERDELIDLLFDGENPLKEVKDGIDKAVERAAALAEEELQKKLQGRVATLLENGMAFNGNFYAIGDTISMDVVTLKAMGDEAFTAFLGRVQVQNEQLVEAARVKEAQRLETERLADLQRKEQAAEALRLEEERKELKRQQDEMNKEKEEMKKQLAEGRRTLLANAGFQLLPNGDMILVLQVSENSNMQAVVKAEVFNDYSGSAWTEAHNTAKIDAEQIKTVHQKYLTAKAEADEKEAKRKEAERLESQLKASRLKMREGILKEVFGMEGPINISQFRPFFVRKTMLNPEFEITIAVSTVESNTDEEWKATVASVRSRFAEVVAAEKQDAEEKAEKKRQQEKAEAEEREAERQRHLGEAQKLAEYVAKIREIKAPIFKTVDLKVAMGIFQETLEKMERMAAIPVSPVEN